MSQAMVIALIVGSTGGIFLLDCLTPIGMILGVLYGCPVYLSGWLPERRSTLITAWISTALTIASYFVSPPGGLFYISVGNRTIAIASIWLTAWLTLMHKRARTVILAQQRELEEANANLERRVIERTEELRLTTAEKERFAGELRIASEIQRSILPRTFPPFPERDDFEIYAETLPAREMGGDFYDFFLIDAERLGFVIADVSGKGVPAAIFMAVTRSLLKATALTAIPPGDCLRHVNDLLCQDNASAMFITVFYGILHTRTGEVVYGSAGHYLPFLLRDVSGIESLRSTGGMALGVLDTARFETRSTLLRKGDTLFLYTDGITEAIDRDERMFAEGRLRAFLDRTNGWSPSAMIQGLVSEVRKFSGDVPQYDDITALALRYRGRP